MSSSSKLVYRDGNALVFPGVEIEHIKSKGETQKITELFDIRIDIQNLSQSFQLESSNIKKIREAVAPLFNQCYALDQVGIQYSKNPEKCVFQNNEIELENAENKTYVSNIKTIWDSLFGQSKISSDVGFVTLNDSNDKNIDNRLPIGQNSVSPQNSSPQASNLNSSTPNSASTTTSTPSVIGNNVNADPNNGASQSSDPLPPVHTSSSTPKIAETAIKSASVNVSHSASKFDPSKFQDEEAVVANFIGSNATFNKQFQHFSLKNLREEADEIDKKKKKLRNASPAYKAYSNLLEHPGSTDNEAVLMRQLIERLYVFKLNQAKTNSSREIQEKSEEEKKILAAESATCFIGVNPANSAPLVQWLTKEFNTKKLS